MKIRDYVFGFTVLLKSFTFVRAKYADDFVILIVVVKDINFIGTVSLDSYDYMAVPGCEFVGECAEFGLVFRGHIG